LSKFKFIAVLLTILFSTSLYAEKQVIETQTVHGKKIDIEVTSNGFIFEQFRGKNVLLDFFGPSCPPCLESIPHLNNLYNQKRDDVVVVGVQVQKSMPNHELKNFMTSKDIKYPVINLDSALELAQFIRANTNWGGQIPFMLMFDRNGKLSEAFVGMTSEEKLLSSIN
jgi:thiol-disulfide isomerase/thioredoxin